MLEILIMIFAGTRLNKMTTEKGISKGWIALVLLVPVVGFIVATIAGIGLAVAGVDEDMLTLAAIPFALGAELLVAWGVIAIVGKQPSRIAQYGQPAYPGQPSGQPVAPYPVPPTAAGFGGQQASYPAPSPTNDPGAPERMAGFCAECGTNVWLNADGSCCNGHSSASISNTYMVARA